MSVIWQKKIFLPCLLLFACLFFITLQRRGILSSNRIAWPQCNSEAKLILLVTSNAPNIKLREAQRTAYSKDYLWDNYRGQRMFLLAGGVNKYEENDVILGDFNESYKHLSLKHLMGLTWAVSQCSENATILKMDDDIAIDLPQIMAKIEGNGMSGWIHSGMKVRRRASKWALKSNEFKEDTYPDFLSGWLYQMSMSNARLIVAKAEESMKDPLWIDDVWITGLLRTQAGITDMTAWNPGFTPYLEHVKCCIQDPKHSCEFIAGPTDKNPDLIRKFAKHAQDCHVQKCPRLSWPSSIKDKCRLKNPLFLPDSQGVGAVLDGSG